MTPQKPDQDQTTSFVVRPQHTCDFPAGLISDYIKIVDQMRTTSGPKK